MTIYQIVAKCYFDNSDEYINVHHYEFTGYQPDVVQLQEAIDNLDTAYKSNLQSVLSNLCELGSYDVRRVDEGDLPAVPFVATDGLWSGGSAGETMPPEMCGLITWKTNQAYPRTTRSYMFPVTEIQNVSPGVPTNGYRTLMGGFATDCMELQVTGGANADKLAVRYGGSPRVVEAFNNVDFYEVATFWGKQGRRRKGVGS